MPHDKQCNATQQRDISVAVACLRGMHSQGTFWQLDVRLIVPYTQKSSGVRIEKIDRFVFNVQLRIDVCLFSRRMTESRAKRPQEDFSDDTGSDSDRIFFSSSDSDSTNDSDNLVITLRAVKTCLLLTKHKRVAEKVCHLVRQDTTHCVTGSEDIP